MKKIIVLLVFFCISLSVFVLNTYAQNSNQKSLAGTVWRSNYFRVAAQYEAEMCFEFTFNGDGTFTRISISQDMVDRKTKARLVDHEFDKWTGFYTENLNRRVTLTYKHPTTGQTYTAGMNCEDWGVNKIRALSFVVVPEHPERQENLMFTKVKEFAYEAPTHDIEVGKDNFVNSANLGDVSKMLCGKVWQEKLGKKIIGSDTRLRGYLFNSDKTYSSILMTYNQDTKKLSRYKSFKEGSYRIENGLLFLKTKGGTEYNYTLVSITDSLLTCAENKTVTEFVILNSKDDNVTKAFTIPYIKTMLEKNYKIDSLLEDVSKPYRTLKGKTYASAISNPKTGIETLQFVADGMILQKYQLPPADGFSIRDGIYTEKEGMLTTVITKPATNIQITTEYNLVWIDSNQFEITKKNSKDKPARFIVQNQRIEK